MAKINVLDMALSLPSSPVPWSRPMIRSRSPVYGEECVRVVQFRHHQRRSCMGITRSIAHRETAIVDIDRQPDKYRAYFDG